MRWWLGRGSQHRQRVGRALERIEEAVAERDGADFAEAFVGYDQAVAAALVNAHSEPETRSIEPVSADLDYEQARDELAEVVAKLEAGGLSLEDSLALWERGEALAKICDRHLAGAKERIESALAKAESDTA